MGSKNITSRLWAVGTILTVTMGTAIVIAPPSTADSSQCSSGSFCVWENSSYSGRFLQSGSSSSNVGDAMNDRMTSYWNRTNQTVAVYEHSNYVGCMLSVAPGSSEAAVHSGFNDRMTSFKVGASC